MAEDTKIVKGSERGAGKTPKCKACGSGSVYVRIKKRSLVCRRCGHIDPIGENN